MKIPAAAAQMIDSFKTKGTLANGAERQAISADQAAEMDKFAQTIDYTVEADNEEGFDLNPAKGELLIKDPNYTTEITVQGDHNKGTMTEVTDFKKPKSQGVIFMETNENSFIEFMCNLDTNGSVTYAEAAFINRKDPGHSYAEHTPGSQA